MRHVSRTKNYWDTGNGQLSMSGSGSSLRLPNYLKKFDKRVSEADTFLQLMIEQTAVSQTSKDYIIIRWKI